jgi:hypothetical protein
LTQAQSDDIDWILPAMGVGRAFFSAQFFQRCSCLVCAFVCTQVQTATTSAVHRSVTTRFIADSDFKHYQVMPTKIDPSAALGFKASGNRHDAS